MLESNLHADNSFVTLTYSDEHLPLTKSTSSTLDSGKQFPSLPTLDPRDLQNWLKRLRRAIAPSKIRYYGCGEYGDETFRPHYHIALFGFPQCRFGGSRYTSYKRNCCSSCDLVRDTWAKGQVYLGDLNTSSAQYIAGYVTKKLTRKSDPKLLGRHPEFGRMSLKPGIGADFMDEVASTLLGLTMELEDVPTQLQHGSRKLPLGRYLRRKLRPLVGLDEATPESTIQAVQEALRPVRQAAFDNSRSFKAEVIKDANQKVLNQEARSKIFKQRRTL